MTRSLKKASGKTGLAPGTVVFVGEQKTPHAGITVIDYDAGQLRESRPADVEECLPYRDTPTITWINVDGLHDVSIVERLGAHFGIHPLVLEDVVHTGQRPKVEDFEDYLFAVFRMLTYDESARAVASEQVSVVLGANFVISFQERAGDVFDPLRDRLRNRKGRIREMGADYLLYSMIDAVVDQYFVILENLGAEIESREESLVTDPDPGTLQAIKTLKRNMISLRKSVWPLREAVSQLERAGSKLVRKPTMPYLRDVYDHTIQVIDAIENYRDMLSGMLDVYLSTVSNRMNEVMKVLTIIATIFMPLAFVAGIYGMNFKYMPELEWPYGYFVALGIMALAAGGMLLYFRRRRWL